MLILLVFCAITLSEIATDIYVPGLPYIKDFFGTEKTLVQLTVSLNLIGIALSSLFYGILSDCYGRRKIFLSGFAVFAISSLLCCFSQNIYFLITMRFFQGIGAGVSSVVGHASIKDVYFGNLYAQIVSRLSTVVSLSPAIAPVIGGLILSRFDWHLLFVIVFILALALFIMIFFFFKETLPYERKENFGLVRLFRSYFVLLSNRVFLVMIGIQACSFMWLWNQIANLPFLFITVMNMKVKHYGYFVTINVLAYILGTVINHKYVGKIGTNIMLFIGILLTIFPDIVLLIINLFVLPNPVLITLIWVPTLIGLALIVTNSIAIALSSVPQTAIARASACLSFTQMAFGALSIYIVGNLFKADSIISISFITVTCSVIALIIYSYRPNKKFVP
ncbi:MAG: multidrug effflux MFS transporter [Rickettsiaceae bacterium H1]|nr:multidrug effflux MFS transporter [Rickettsiaceae bacterium H1]